MRFQVIIGLQDKGLYDDFKLAFQEFCNTMKEKVEEGCNYAWLNTNFIVFKFNDQESPFDFYQVIDLGHKWGLLNSEGEFSDDFDNIEITNLQLMQKMNENYIEILCAEYASDFQKLMEQT